MINDNYLEIVFLSGTILLVLFAFFITFYLIIHKRKQNAYHLERNKMIFDHQNKLLTARIEEQERTMDQMSKEIHDNIGQLLNFTKMTMFAIAKYTTDNRQTALVDKAKGLLDQIIKDTQNLSHSLNSDYIKTHGLITVLQEEIDSINFSKEILCTIEVKGIHKTFDPDKELLMYRIAQEAIHNITKHAQAAELVITLTYHSDEFSMSIADNGIGFEKSKMYELNGIGFLNMLNRAKLLNGTLDIESQPMSGCVVTLRTNKIHELIRIQQDIDVTVANDAIAI